MNNLSHLNAFLSNYSASEFEVVLRRSAMGFQARVVMPGWSGPVFDREGDKELKSSHCRSALEAMSELDSLCRVVEDGRAEASVAEARAAVCAGDGHGWELLRKEGG